MTEACDIDDSEHNTDPSSPEGLTDHETICFGIVSNKLVTRKSGGAGMKRLCLKG